MSLPRALFRPMSLVALLSIGCLVFLTACREQTKTKPQTGAKASTDAPKTETPKTEPPKAEPPKTEPPKTEPPKTEPPKAEPPKAEPPKAEPPKAEPPKAEPPKTEPPKTEMPKVEPPKVEPPKTETPKAEPPKPSTETSSTTVPVSPAPKLDEKYRPKLLVSLPDECNTPDGMRLNPKTGEIIVSCPNFNDLKFPAKLIKITKDNQWAVYFDKLPLHPETGKAHPMGIDFGPDGNIYYADNQYFLNKDHKSRLVRVKIENDKPVGAEVVVDGFKLSNAVIWKGKEVYVTDTFFDLPDKPGTSGVYRFTLDELNKGPVKLHPKTEPDSHLVVTLETKPLPERANEMAGADGMTFDSKGNLWVGNFGDGQIFRVSFNDDGSVKAKDRIAGPPRLTCCDGMFCDLKTDKIYIADSAKNAIQVLSPDGTVTTLWEDGDNDGSDGKLDQPCEPGIRGDELIIVNFDMPFPGLLNSKYDAPHTISVIKLK